MGSEWEGGRNGDDGAASLDEIARLDAYLDGLAAERRPDATPLSVRERDEQMLAAQLRLTREDVDTPDPAYLARLERDVRRAVAATAVETVPEPARAGRRRGPSRRGFLRVAATFAGGAGLGAAGVEGAAAAVDDGRPHHLVVPGNERWYPIARTGEIPPGGSKPFAAGGVLGYLFNDGGHLHAVSAICTHMGCRLKPTAGETVPAGLRCLCHGSRFDRAGSVVTGAAPSALPRIALRTAHGHVYALGTRESV